MHEVVLKYTWTCSSCRKVPVSATIISLVAPTKSAVHTISQWKVSDISACSGELTWCLKLYRVCQPSQLQVENQLPFLLLYRHKIAFTHTLYMYKHTPICTWGNTHLGEHMHSPGCCSQSSSMYTQGLSSPHREQTSWPTHGCYLSTLQLEIFQEAQSHLLNLSGMSSKSMKDMKDMRTTPWSCRYVQ